MAKHGWISKFKGGATKGLDSETLKLRDAFRLVSSVEECLTIFSSEGLLEISGLSEPTCNFLYHVCHALRKEGLELEPNLLGRAVVRTMLDRYFVGKASEMFASHDSDFLNYAATANIARDQGNYKDAQYHYWLALKIFPFHYGYLVQYGHCLKEQNLNSDALVAYLDAYFYGASRKDVEIHALHVGQAINRCTQVEVIFKRPHQPIVNKQTLTMDWPVTSNDVGILINLLHIRTPSIEEVAQKMCEYASRRELFLALLNEPQFAYAHRDLLCLIAETNWGAQSVQV